MKHRIAIGAFLAVALLVGGAIAADKLKSGPQVGEKIPGAFNVRVSKVEAYGENLAGKTLCLV